MVPSRSFGHSGAAVGESEGACSLSTDQEGTSLHPSSLAVHKLHHRRQRRTSNRAPSPIHHPHRSCMLGLRPRLKARPSFLDLVRRGSIDQISQRPVLLEADARPTQIPLPQSPVIAPQEPEIVVSPTPEEEEGISGSVRKEEAKMGPVSFALCRGLAGADGGVIETAAEKE